VHVQGGLELVGRVRAEAARFVGDYPQGDPRATADAILTIVDAEPPLRVLLGAPPLSLIRAAYEQRLATWNAWDSLAQAAQGRMPASA
jgi:hypothetical protein